MAGFIELATLKAPVVADAKGFRTGMEIVKKEGKAAANEVEKEFQNTSKKMASSWDNAAKKIQKSLKTTEKEAKDLTKTAENIYKDGFGKSANDVVKSLMQTKRAMGDIDSKELETATKRAMELRDTLGVKMSTSLKMAKQEMEAYGSTADQAFDRVNKRLDQNQAAWGKLGAIGDKTAKLGMALTAGVTLPLLGLATAAGKTASDFESANAKIVSSLGLTEQQGIVTKKAIQDIYSDGFGESIDDVAESIIQVKKQLGDIPDDQIKKVTENAIVLRDTLGQDMGESLRGVNSLMKNFGMTADDAMDLYVKGVQTGLDKTGELGDNLAEYGQLWSQAGFSAKEMFAVLDNGLKSGAYNLDKVNDFVKEFTISLSDGRIEKNLSSFSQGTRDIFAEFKKGGKTSQDVFKSVITDLEKTTNQQDKLSLAGTVWSALGEDNAMKIIESLNDVNGTYDNVAGTMEKVKQQQNATFGSRFKSTLRDAQTALLPLGETLLNLAERYMPKIEKAVQGFSDTLSNLSEDDIDRILKIGGFVAIAGPTVIGIGKVTSAISTIGGALRIGAGAMGLFGASSTGAATALGTGGGGLIAGLGAVAMPATLAVAGITAVGLAAYAGIKAYEAHQLSGEKWGTSVTKEQDKVITKSYELADKAKADVAAYADGVKGAAKDVVQSNNDIVDSIDKTLKKEKERREKAASKLTDPGMKKDAEEYADYKAKLDQKTLESAKATVNNINKIMADASLNNRNLSTEERNYIAENYRSLTDDQLQAAGFSKDKRVAIEAAYQKDMSTMSSKQLNDREKNVIEGLKKEKTWYDKQKDALKENYTEGTVSYEKQLGKLDKLNHQNTESMILGLAKINKAQGFAVGDMSDTWKRYGWSVKEVQKLLNDSGKDSTKEAENLGKILKAMDRDWDSIELDPKTGKLSVEGKEELVQSLLETSKWKTLSLDEKKLLVDGDEARIAFLDSLSDAKKWEQYKILEKELGVNNSKAIQAIMEAEDGVNRWNSLQPADKEFLAKNDKVLKVVLSSEQALQRYKDFPPAEQQLLANNQVLLAKVLESEENLNRWNKLQAADKEFLAKNEKLLNTVLSSDEALRRYNEFPPAEQEFLGDNTDLLNVIIGSQEAFDNYSRLEPDEKQFIASNKDLIDKVLTGTGSIEEFNKYPALMKMFNGVDATGQPVAFAKENIDKFNQTKADPVVLGAVNAAKAVVNDVLVDLEKLPKYRGISIGIERVGGGLRDPNFANGTPGLPEDQWAIINDQKGPLYEELVTPPGGEPFIIPKQRDVLIPLKKGTRIDKASDTEKLRRGLPHFANGVNNQQPLPFVGYNATFKKHTASSPTNTKVVSNSPVININNPVWHSEKDLRKTLQDAAFILNIDERGALDG
ncbi:MAG: phage tail tape measure protein [Lactococcus sp.]|nr:phage tail tape measure protein [Lactococcus sp.]MDN5411128.1 phage tail tape measure protein [Lactococcus sp.]MDN5467327.1 phage tail tape measure protein [Lactococcus raffinolactis]